MSEETEDTIEQPTASFGALIKQYRRARELTQGELAERAQLSLHTVNNLERGIQHVPRKDTVQLLAQALTLSADEEKTFVAAARSGRRSSLAGNAEPTPEPIRVERWQVPPVPMLATPLIGRTEALATASRLLSEDTTRLLTLVGPPGVGKTSLALAIAATQTDRFAAGCLWVPLAAVQDAALVPGSIAQALHLHETETTSLTEVLQQWLHNKQMLLILDNFEQVSAAAAFIADLLSYCPQLCVLATSRTPLHLRSEHLYAVSLLAIPTEDQAMASLEGFTQIDSVALFLRRAQAIRPDFRITQEDVAAMTSICRRLDGLPLALELAAARLNIFSLNALAMRLDHALRLLTDGPRDLPTHQQTLRSTLAWSYNLLPSQVQAMLRWLAVFAGGCTLEAAEAVCNSMPGDNAAARSFLDDLSHLLDHHLLTRQDLASEQHQATEAMSGFRVTMLETIREYAWEQLTACGELPDAERAHATYYLKLAETAAPCLRGSEQAFWLACLEREHDNLRSALRWTIQQKEVEMSLRLAGSLWLFWVEHGYYSEGRSWLEQALRLAPEEASAEHLLEGANGLEHSAADQESLQQRTALRATLHNGIGSLATLMGNYDTALEQHRQALALRRTTGVTGDIASSLNNLGGVTLELGDYARTQVLWEESLALRRQIGEDRLIAVALMNLGVLASYRGEYARSVVLLEECLPLFRALEIPVMLSRTLNSLGGAYFYRGQLLRATAVVEESLSLAESVHHQRDQALALYSLALIARFRGDYEQALEQCVIAHKIHKELGGQWHQAETLWLQACLAGDVGAYAEAEQLLGESLAIRRAIRYKQGCADVFVEFGSLACLCARWSSARNFYGEALRQYLVVASIAGTPTCLEGCAKVALELGQASTSARLLGKAAALRVSESLIRPPREQACYDQTTKATSNRLGNDCFTQEWLAGEVTPVEQAITEALTLLAD